MCRGPRHRGAEVRVTVVQRSVSQWCRALLHSGAFSVADLAVRLSKARRLSDLVVHSGQAKSAGGSHPLRSSELIGPSASNPRRSATQ